MNNYFYIFILISFLASGCSNQYTGLGFPYSNQDKQAKIESIEIPEEVRCYQSYRGNFICLS